MLGLAIFAVLLALRVALNYVSLRHYLKLPLVERVAVPSELPSVTVVVPAEAGEEPELEALLRNLTSLDYQALDLIVAGSCDPALAARFGAVFVPVAGELGGLGVGQLDAGLPRSGSAAAVGALAEAAHELPPGWWERNFACWVGAREALGEWLLFTDARTTHKPESLRRIIGFAAERGASAVSVFFQQQADTFWERILLPIAWQQFFSGVSPFAVNQPRLPRALASGHYLLVQRQAYFRAGGHEAVRGEALDQLALAACLKPHGERVIAARAERLGEVRMFDSPNALRHGLRLAVRPALKSLGSGAFWPALTSVLGLLALGCLAYGLIAGSHVFLLAALVAYLSSVAELFLWQFLFGAAVTDAVWQPVSSLTLLLIGFSGLLRPAKPPAA